VRGRKVVEVPTQAAIKMEIEKPRFLCGVGQIRVVSEDFVLGPGVRGWLDDDEYLVRRRIHGDMRKLLASHGL